MPKPSIGDLRVTYGVEGRVEPPEVWTGEAWLVVSPLSDKERIERLEADVRRLQDGLRLLAVPRPTSAK